MMRRTAVAESGVIGFSLTPPTASRRTRRRCSSHRERRDTNDVTGLGDEEAVPTAGDGRSKTLQVLLLNPEEHEEHEELQRLAASRGLSTSTVAREAILRLVRPDATPRSAEDRSKTGRSTPDTFRGTFGGSLGTLSYPAAGADTPATPAGEALIFRGPDGLLDSGMAAPQGVPQLPAGLETAPAVAITTLRELLRQSGGFGGAKLRGLRIAGRVTVSASHHAKLGCELA